MSSPMIRSRCYYRTPMRYLFLVYRTQVASLTAELAAEKGVVEETRNQLLTARNETSHQQAQVRGQEGVSVGYSVMFVS